MGTESKKLSFGFKKILKPQPKHEERKQFIDCLEGKSIKVKGSEMVEEKKPLVIPLSTKDKYSLQKEVINASFARIAKEVESNIFDNDLDNEKNINTVPVVLSQNETLESKAERELIEEALQLNNVKVETNSSLVVPIGKLPAISGEKESTLRDYEDMPIKEFGMAMLRGMGWSLGKGMGKHKAVDIKLPTLRPKGMGLGADKISIDVKNSLENSNKSQDELKIVKGSYVKIISGKQTGIYGQVTGFDEDSGRLIMKAAINGINININELSITPVTKDEYRKFSKVLNSAKFDEYKIKSEIENKSQDTYYRNKSEKSKYHDRKKNQYKNREHKRNRDINEKHRDNKYQQRSRSSSESSYDEKKKKKRERRRSRSRNQ